MHLSHGLAMTILLNAQSPLRYWSTVQECKLSFYMNKETISCLNSNPGQGVGDCCIRAKVAAEEERPTTLA